MQFKTIEWRDNKVLLIDQRKLPLEETYVECSDYMQVADAIRNMTVRGAPAIGVTAAMGVALGAMGVDAKDFQTFCGKMEGILTTLLKTRPTAVNLRWGVDRMRRVMMENQSSLLPELKERLKLEALRICEEDIEMCRKIGEHGATLIQSRQTILTHCNAGALATAGQGTALSLFYSAWNQGKRFEVFADETRPFLQGSRLTAWELAKNGIPVTLITDNMSAYFMRQKKIQSVVVGADRITANGDVANKIGTYGVAVLAKEHRVPFYVAAPTSTIDLAMATGEEIPIEERDTEEVTNFYRQRVAPDGIKVRNPVFDVTPHELVTAIVTEKGILRGPYGDGLKKLFDPC
ncbi:MAG: S-methyl-5-thioribose-1-phosphate isomerase [Deltaproteobacteria bacterium]|nr:S-methyl-5-thioribose-1-phosphate isomerase [Deltaproteobacteria bacterium]MBI4373658.1 S-methyl-5-thioribose-1-phosphate isomerase [Deltaproteobacteria bacterium]